MEWKTLCKVDSDWVDRYLLDHDIDSKNKVVVRAFSIKFSGTEENILGFVEHLTNIIPYFVFSKKEIEEYNEKGLWVWKEAMHYFGNISPESDGRYGELLLFLLVESILKIPMIVHKIKVGTSIKEQIKGSDGIFFGNYNDIESLLFGESKIYKNKNDGINDALNSIIKFHKGAKGYGYLKQELVVASKHLTADLTPHQVEYLSELLDPLSNKYQEINFVHPILLLYNEEKISEIENKCRSKEEGESLICDLFKYVPQDLLKNIIGKLEKDYGELFKIFLDFFIIGIKDVDTFRKTMYRRIHNL